MQRSQGVRPALRNEPTEIFAHLDAEQRVVDPSFGFVDVELGRHHVIVAGEHDRRAAREKFGGMGDQAIEPTELEVEFLASDRIAVRHVQAADQEAVDRGLDVAARRVVLISRESAPRLDQVFAARENGDSVPAFLALPDRLVARRTDGALRKRFRFQFLQADHVGRGLLKPAEKNGQPAIDAIDVEGRDLHALSFSPQLL